MKPSLQVPPLFFTLEQGDKPHCISTSARWWVIRLCQMLLLGQIIAALTHLDPYVSGNHLSGQPRPFLYCSQGRSQTGICPGQRSHPGRSGAVLLLVSQTSNPGMKGSVLGGHCLDQSGCSKGWKETDHSDISIFFF